MKGEPVTIASISGKSSAQTGIVSKFAITLCNNPDFFFFPLEETGTADGLLANSFMFTPGGMTSLLQLEDL
jgi:hypothetical protein